MSQTKGATIDVGAWLRDLGLGQYEAAFRESVEDTVLPNLAAEDLKELGVGPWDIAVSCWMPFRLTG